MEEGKTLAERCFDSEELEMELFHAVNKILDCDTEKCLAAGFIWGAVDVFWDSYDESVEVIRPTGAESMTQSQADAILQLGFYIIWESIGEECWVWGSKGKTKSGHSREGSETKRLRVQRDLLAQKVRELEYDLSIGCN